MTINSNIETALRTNFYSDSEDNEQWIQPSITSQKMSEENIFLIDELYIQVTNASPIRDIDPSLNSDFLLWEAASNFDLINFEENLENSDG